MEFVRKLRSRKTEKGNYVSMGVFICGRCGNEVERSLSNGRTAEINTANATGMTPNIEASLYSRYIAAD